MSMKPFSDIDLWLEARRGKFTSSEIYKLLTPGKPGEMFSPGAYTYIKQKALEMAIGLHERPEMDEVESLLHGKVHERPAFEWYQKSINDYKMQHIGSENPIFLDYEPLMGESGGSPDALCLRDDATVRKLSEIKCPKNSMKHFDRLLWVTQWDVKEKYPQCYAQIQHLFMITGAEEADFVSYDDRFKRYEQKGKIISILPDKKFQDNLDIRIRMAIKEKYKIFDRHMNAA